ncbi:MAG: NAD(+) synthase [Peptostreptococcales bacterium]
MSDNLGIILVAAATPRLKVANPDYNCNEMIECIKKCDPHTSILVFPELAITGYTCGDLFFQNTLYSKNIKALMDIAQFTYDYHINTCICVGFYLKVEGSFYNCAAFIKQGEIKGIVPKTFLPNTKESYEGRWFASGYTISQNMHYVSLEGKSIPFGPLVFKDEVNDINIGIEIGEDLQAPISPGTLACLNGAHIILNPSASNELVGQADYRKNLVNQESSKNLCGYVYASSGVHESTTDLVYSGHCLISENGTLISESDRFIRNAHVTYGELDTDKLKFERCQNQAYPSFTPLVYGEKHRPISLSPMAVLTTNHHLKKTYSKTPFIPHDGSIGNRCEDIFRMQTTALAKRIEHLGFPKLILGVSGGLDSTLALLVCYETCKALNISSENIMAVTMPGFGTTDKTYQNALSLMALLGVATREISIKEAVIQHFIDIEHDINNHDVTYENSQARERTQILMDLSNKYGGIVIGTGDLSEVALGWSTYNGDHMSMYNVNVSIPKTLIPSILKWIMNNKFEDMSLKNTLKSIIDTPISPELLPPDSEGIIQQKTEDTVGPYLLHDFFLYYTIRYGMAPKKLFYIASSTFGSDYSKDQIKKWLALFYNRFFSQQFKRSCAPDGPKVGTVSLSPRGNWKMPSDADVSIWLDEIKNI